MTAKKAAKKAGKGKLALYWAASCGGCEIAVLGIDDKILQVADAFDIVFWMEDKSIDLCLFNGAIRTSEQEYMARLMRQKSKVLVAFGSCAHEGCIPGLANVTNREEIFQTAYHDTPDGIRPQTETEVEEGMLYLPLFYDTVKTLGQTVEVDYTLPGCPPEPERIWDAIVAILENKLPAPGAVIDEKKITEFKRTWEIIPDTETCLLEQGIVCAGIATRAGCGALCPTVGSPCIGCYGPNEGADDFGARMMTALASVIDSDDPDEIDRIIQEGIPDPIAAFYRFSLPASQLRRIAFSEQAEETA
jgi:F420-non-reducing hydrogenase small subunit